MKLNFFSANNKRSHLLLMAAALFLSACNANLLTNENGSNSENSLISESNGGDSKTSSQTITLNRDAVVYFLDGDVLRPAGVLQPSSVITILLEAKNVNPDYIDAEGKRQRSSTGFWGPVRLSKVVFKGSPVVPISQLNSESYQLFISSTLSDLLNDKTNKYAAIKANSIPSQAEYLKYFTKQGRPVKSFTTSLKNRFPGKLNQGISASSLSPGQREKWNKIYAELKTVGDRTVVSNKQLLIADKTWAQTASLSFEKTGTVQPYGAWSIAVLGTATRRGFENVPCAEFMSEVLRQAYRRAGYSFLPDFSEEKTNPLIWYHTNRVQNLADSLYKAGWIPWDSATFRPLTGSIMMHAQATSPGHTYMAAGFDGRLIIDNGAPQGRDLSTTVGKTIDLMFQHGVFFLPPGVNPKPW